MEKDLSTLCSELLDTIQKETDVIIKQIDSFYNENKQKEDVKYFTKLEFEEQLLQFRLKYNSPHVGITNNGVFIAPYPECDEKRKEIVAKLINYIDNLD